MRHRARQRSPKGAGPDRCLLPAAQAGAPQPLKNPFEPQSAGPWQLPPVAMLNHRSSDLRIPPRVSTSADWYNRSRSAYVGVDGTSDFNALNSGRHNEEVQLCAFDVLAMEATICVVFRSRCARPI